jgi:hypothetical protein
MGGRVVTYDLVVVDVLDHGGADYEVLLHELVLLTRCEINFYDLNGLEK